MNRTSSRSVAKWTALAFLGAVAIVVVANCNRSEEGAQQPAAPAAPAAPTKAEAQKATGGGPSAPAAPAGVGTIHGRVVFSGKAPAMPLLKRTQDAFCAHTPMHDEEVVVNPNGTLRNVILHVANVEAASEPPAAQAEIHQEACMYRPRAQTIVAGQTILVKNLDKTLHNVHTYRGTDTVFNQAQVPGSPAIERQFTDGGALVKFKCDVHPWMTGFVWVGNNALSATTGEDGTFTIANVPSGARTIQAWQERFGTHDVEVTVQPNQTAEVTVTYTGTETPAP